MLFKKLIVFLFVFLIGQNLSAKKDFETIVKEYSPNLEKGLIYIDKQELVLTLFSSNGEVIAEYPVACGRNLGQKQKVGDFKTPEGVFYVKQIQDSSKWGHDFKDGNGFIKHAYGPWFIRLETGRHKGIGIHGTHAPESIGTRATEGCIRLNNDNLTKLKPYIVEGITVVIGPDFD